MSAGGPLSGITVIDFSELLPGPFFTQNLAEMGARVIKIERPPGGDNARRMGAGSFASINRGKQSLLVDLKDDSQRARVRELISTADVLVESYRPGVMARLGFDHASLRAEFPRLVYVSLSGYGQDGPWANLPGHDINYLAAAGVLAVSGPPEGPPEQSFGLPVADLCGSMYALSSTLAALFQRERTGRGQHLDVALAECVLHWMNPRLGAFQGGVADSLDQQRAATQIKPAYGTFRCRDNGYLSVAALEDHFWHRLCGVLDMGEFAADAYHELDARKKRARDINTRIAEQMGKQDIAVLNEMLILSDIPASPVLAPSELAASPQFAQRGLMVGDAPLSLVRYPVVMEGVVPEALVEAPVLDSARHSL
jgi:crotonobetainyl-CoA:carnitine CoA-transferase CaiB-like acyl-CoA transferase